MFLAASSALRTRGGDIGTWVMRTPKAFDMALAMAASGGTIAVPETPGLGDALAGWYAEAPSP